MFKALEGQLKPGLNMVVTTEFEHRCGRPAGPPVDSHRDSRRRARQRRRTAPTAGSPARCSIHPARSASPCGRRSARHASTRSGRFLMRAAVGDEIVIETDPPIVGSSPKIGGVQLNAGGR